MRSTNATAAPSRCHALVACRKSMHVDDDDDDNDIDVRCIAFRCVLPVEQQQQQNQFVVVFMIFSTQKPAGDSCLSCLEQQTAFAGGYAAQSYGCVYISVYIYVCMFVYVCMMGSGTQNRCSFIRRTEPQHVDVAATINAETNRLARTQTLSSLYQGVF